jgi:hypothetical protein
LQYYETLSMVLIDNFLGHSRVTVDHKLIIKSIFIQNLFFVAKKTF